jgi:hypothetical protein
MQRQSLTAPCLTHIPISFCFASFHLTFATAISFEEKKPKQETPATSVEVEGCHFPWCIDLVQVLHTI